MKRWCVLFVVLILLAAPAAAQGSDWCGYALLEGLPILDHQLSMLAAITPTRSFNSRPHELFQYRFSLDRTAVIVEGCWRLEPSRDVVLSLLTQAFTYDPKMIDVIGDVGSIGKPGEDILASDVIRAYLDKLLTYTLFAPGGTMVESSAAVRDYLTRNIRAWEVSEQEVVCDARSC